MKTLIVFSVVSSEMTGDIVLGITGSFVLLLAVVASFGIVYSIPGIGGKICKTCCKYIDTYSRKCSYCHERQLSRKNYEVRKRAEKREHERVYQEVEKVLFDTLIDR